MSPEQIKASSHLTTHLATHETHSLHHIKAARHHTTATMTSYGHMTSGRGLFAWQALYPEPPDGAAAREAAAGVRLLFDLTQHDLTSPFLSCRITLITLIHTTSHIHTHHTPLTPLYSHNVSHTHSSHTTQLTQHLAHTFISNHSSFTTRLIISRHSCHTTHLTHYSSYTTYLTPPFSHQTYHTTYLTPPT